MSHILKNPLMLPVVCLALLSSVALGETREFQYSGTLTQLSRQGESAPVKQFDLYALLRSADSGQECFHLVTERGGGGCIVAAVNYIKWVKINQKSLNLSQLKSK